MDAPAMTATVLGFVAGAALGLVHFGALGWIVRAFAAGLAVRAAVLQMARFALLGAALFGLARLGAGPLIAGFAGIMAARQGVLWRARRAP
jgi:F1F0 ATPase subunit 2